MAGRIGIITSPERLARIEASVPVDKGYETDAQTASGVDIGRALKDWRRAGYTVAIIDEEAVVDKRAMEAALITYQMTTLPKGAAPLRIVFIAAEDRDGASDLLSRLVQARIHDLIVPNNLDTIEDMLPDLIMCGQSYAHVKGYDKGLPMPRETYHADSPPEVQQVVVERPVVIERVKGTVTIAVAGTHLRVGATSFAISTARSLALLGKPVACVLHNDVSFASLRDVYEHAIANDGRSMSIAGVTYYCGTSPAVVVGPYDFIVLDLGYFKGRAQDSHERELEFRRPHNIKAVISDGAPWAIGDAENYVQGEHPADVEGWHWGFFGADDSMTARIRDGFARKAPKAHIFKVSFLPNPVEAASIPPEFYGLMRGYVKEEEPDRRPGLLGRLMRRG